MHLWVKNAARDARQKAAADANGKTGLLSSPVFFAGDEPKSELARDQGVSLQSRNAPSGASGDLTWGEKVSWRRIYVNQNRE